MRSAYRTQLTHYELPTIAARQHGVFTLRQALASGLSRSAVKRRLCDGRFTAVGRGVYRASLTPASWRQELMAACLGVHGVVSHRSAAGLWCFSGEWPDIVEVTALRHRRAQRAGIICHESQTLFAQDVTEIDGLPVTAPTRTLLDLAVVLTHEDVEVALDDAQRRSLTSIPRLRTMLDALGPQRLGSTRMLGVLDARPATGAVPESYLETRFVQLVRDAGLPEPERQVRVESGGRVAFLDFAYPKKNLAIELDGYEGHGGRSAWQAGLERTNRISQVGWRSLHFSSTDIERRPADVVDHVRAALQ